MSKDQSPTHRMRSGQSEPSRETFYFHLDGPPDLFTDHYAVVITSNDRSHKALLLGGTITVGHRSTIMSGISDPLNGVLTSPESNHTHHEHRLRKAPPVRAALESNLIDHQGLTYFLDRFVPPEGTDPSHDFWAQQKAARAIVFNGTRMGCNIGAPEDGVIHIGLVRLCEGKGEIGIHNGVPFYSVNGGPRLPVGSGSNDPAVLARIEALEQTVASVSKALNAIGTAAIPPATTAEPRPRPTDPTTPTGEPPAAS